MEHDTEITIRDRAYFLWLEEGQPEGDHERHWQQACAEIAGAPAAEAAEQTAGADATAKA